MAKLPEVREDSKDLHSLIERCRTPAQKLRLRALLLIQENPEESLDVLAARLGRSPRTLKRWLGEYKRKGIKAFTADRDQDNQSLSESQLQELYGVLEERNFQTVKDIRRWLLKHFNITITEAGIRGILKRLNARHVWTVKPLSSPESIASAIQRQLLSVMNHLPIASDGKKWETEARNILQNALPDVDRVTIVLNSACDLLNPEEYSPVQTIVQHKSDAGDEVSVVRYGGEKEQLENLLRAFRQQGHYIDHYRLPPEYRHYFYRGAYIGSIIFWREKRKNNISEVTLQVIDLLEPLLLHSMLYALMSHLFANPLEKLLIRGFNDLLDDAELTSTELKIVSYRLFGMTYREIAEQLDVSIDAIKKPIQRVYQKTGTGSHSQFTRKYFLSRFGSFFKA